MCRQLREFFQGPRYRINKFLLSLNGQWLYQQKSKKNLLISVTFWFFFTGLFGQVFIRESMDKRLQFLK